MPHIEHSASNLDNLYPSISAPTHDGLDDYADESTDVVLQHGIKIAAQIQLQSEMHGRRRRPEPLQKQPTSTDLPVENLDGNEEVPLMKKRLFQSDHELIALSEEECEEVTHGQSSVVMATSRILTSTRLSDWIPGRHPSPCPVRNVGRYRLKVVQPLLTF